MGREAGRTTRTSSRDPSTYTATSPSRTTPSQTHDRKRARGAGHNKDRDIPDFMDKIAKIQNDATHAALRSTPAGEHSVSKSMVPISTYVGRPDDGDDDPSDDDSDYDDDDNGDRGRRGRDHDDDEGSRRGIKRKRKQKALRGSGPILGAPKMPGLDPKNYFWNGKTAFLRYYIEKWRKLLDPTNYSPASAVNFMLSCVPKDKQQLISDCTTLEEVLQELALHATDSTTLY